MAVALNLWPRMSRRVDSRNSTMGRRWQECADSGRSLERTRRAFSCDGGAEIKRTVRKHGLSGFPRSVGDVEWRMAHISGFRRDQFLLLPEAVDDYLEADNSVRFIDVFVDGVDLAAAGFGRVDAKATGRPGYAPGDLLKLYIYGYLNRVRSSRRLERECRCNVEVIWLLGASKPGFKTIVDFRRDNRAAFRGVFRQFVLLSGARPQRPRVAGGRRNSHQGGQQQGPQLPRALRGSLRNHTPLFFRQSGARLL